jgi:DNA-binding transcriptional MerR regulator
MPITVREIAERTGHAGSKPFIERLHYWTREGLLKPVGERSPGKGKRVTYPDTAVQHALILGAMMERGVSVEDQRRAMKIVREDLALRMRPDLWPQKTGLLLIIEKFSETQTKVRFHDEGPYMFDKRFEYVAIFNLNKMFAILQNETGGTNV